MRGRKRKGLKRRKNKDEEEEEEEEEEGKRQVTNGDRESERESHLCEAKCFYNSVRDLVVWHINKTSDFSIIPLLWYK